MKFKGQMTQSETVEKYMRSEVRSTFTEDKLGIVIKKREGRLHKWRDGHREKRG